MLPNDIKQSVWITYAQWNVGFVIGIPTSNKQIDILFLAFHAVYVIMVGGINLLHIEFVWEM